MFCIFPIQNSVYQRDRQIHGGYGRPEAHFYTSLFMVWLFPICLFWFAFTSNGQTSYWSPIIAGTLLGVGVPHIWLAMMNYIAGKPHSILPLSSNTLRLILNRYLPAPRCLSFCCHDDSIICCCSHSVACRYLHVRQSHHHNRHCYNRCSLVHSCPLDILCLLPWKHNSTEIKTREKAK
jgi:hypothetical protein